MSDKKRIAALTFVVCAPLLALGVVPAANAATTAPVEISKIRYNPPGIDDLSTASLYQEYVRLTNTTTKAISVTGWTVRDKAGHVYVITGATLEPGNRLYVHTGAGVNGEPDNQHRYWGSHSYIWNNTGDTATLKSSTGATIDVCGYKPATSGAAYC